MAAMPVKLTEKSARLLLARTTDPYDEKIVELTKAVGPLELVGRAISEGRLTDGTDLSPLADKIAQLGPDHDENKIAGDLGLRTLIPGDSQWPIMLEALPTPPLALWVRGHADLMATSLPSIAITGARAATAYGEQVAMSLAHDLGQLERTIVAGGAHGIDAAAHRGALAAGKPTIVVMGAGIDMLYPRSNADLMRRATLCISEYAPGTPAARMRLIYRNRLIAALSAGTVLVEAALRSGARTTARYARELGRPVMAVPGPINSITSVGCHQEIRDGAHLVTDAQEIYDVVNDAVHDTLTK